MDYEKTFADPDKLRKLVDENKQMILLLEKARDRLLQVEQAQEKKIEEMPPGSVWDEQEKRIISNEISKFDPELAKEISEDKNKKKIMEKIEARIKEIEKSNKKFNNGLGSLKKRQEATMAKGGKLVEKILKQMAAIRGLEQVEESILKQNSLIRAEIKKHLENSNIGYENIDDFVNLAKRLEENNKKDHELREKIIRLREQLEELKKQGEPIETEFIEQSKELRKKAA